MLRRFEDSDGNRFVRFDALPGTLRVRYRAEVEHVTREICNALQISRRAGGDGGPAKVASEVMERQVGQMVRLVDDLLDVSCISRGRIELRRTPIDLVALVRQAVEAARPDCESRGITPAVALPPQPLVLDADPVRLAQVVGNLLNNACKFGNEGDGIRITVDVDAADAVIRLRDDGIGIAVEQLPHIFDMFMQVDTSLGRSGGGLGIGLTFVKKLVELHGGTVQALSAGIGRGTEFAVRLPIAIRRPSASGAER
jgi:two-component system, chemotaxis family, CheB/CheR fusion protein